MRRTPTDKFNGISSDAVKAKTGKTWAEWLRVLDAEGAKEMDHKEIVAVLSKKHGIGPWWQQMVTVGYEQARGKRVKHQTAAGFSISRSKTLTAAPSVVFAAWNDTKKRGRWLADPGVTIRKAITGRSLRITWIDGATSVEVMFYEKGEGKTQLSVQHSKLASAAAGARMKKYWGDQLEKLQAMVEK
jgi:uncharacterized protein YndB with AHSA1/START domain